MGVTKERLKVLRPYENTLANDALEQVRTISADAETEFRKVYDLLGAKVNLNATLERIEGKYGPSEKTKLERAHLEAERLEKERLEKERREKERREKERREQDRLEKERSQRASLEAARREKECREKERREQDRLELARLKAERREKEGPKKLLPILILGLLLLFLFSLAM